MAHTCMLCYTLRHKDCKITFQQYENKKETGHVCRKALMEGFHLPFMTIVGFQSVVPCGN